MGTKKLSLSFVPDADFLLCNYSMVRDKTEVIIFVFMFCFYHVFWFL